MLIHSLLQFVYCVRFSRPSVLPSHEGQVLLLGAKQPARGAHQVNKKKQQFNLLNNLLVFNVILCWENKCTLVLFQVPFCVTVKARHPQRQVSSDLHT